MAKIDDFLENSVHSFRNSALRYWRRYSGINPFLFLGISTIVLLFQVKSIDTSMMHGRVSYRKELRLAVALKHIPATMIPPRDRPTIAAMRAGKRVSLLHFDNLRESVRPYLQARRRLLLQQQMNGAGRRPRSVGTHAS